MYSLIQRPHCGRPLNVWTWPIMIGFVVASHSGRPWRCTRYTVIWRGAEALIANCSDDSKILQVGRHIQLPAFFNETSTTMAVLALQFLRLAASAALAPASYRMCCCRSEW